MKQPSIFSAQSVALMVSMNDRPARPRGAPYFGKRLHAAWLVFTGQADAVLWPGTAAHDRRWQANV